MRIVLVNCLSRCGATISSNFDCELRVAVFFFLFLRPKKSYWRFFFVMSVITIDMLKPEMNLLKKPNISLALSQKTFYIYPRHCSSLSISLSLWLKHTHTHTHPQHTPTHTLSHSFSLTPLCNLAFLCCLIGHHFWCLALKLHFKKGFYGFPIKVTFSKNIH